MQSNTQVGNRVILLVVAGVLAISSLFMTWGTITLTPKHIEKSIVSSDALLGGGEMVTDLLYGMVGMKVSPNGLSGHLTIGQFVIPYWIGIGAVVLALLMLATNIVRFSSIPKWIIGGLLLLGAVMAVWSVVVITSNGTLGAGILLFATAIGIGLFQLGTESALKDHGRGK